MFLSPQWDRSCGDCKKWVYADGEGVPADKRGTVETFAGRPLPRGQLTPTPCYRCEKIPLGIREKLEPSSDGSAYAIEPELRHRRAVYFHLECRSVRQWPADAMVRRNAALIEPVIQKSERQPLEVLAASVLALSVRRR